MKGTYTNALPAGTVLNHRYHIEKPLGAGGFGMTYMGRDMKLNMPVAIKEYYESDAVSRKRQLAEAQTMARFSGEQNIVNVRDFFEENQKTYIVMEYLDGVTLKEYLEKNGTLSMKQALDLLVPIMDVLEKIHRAGAIHRDVSPDNIMLTRDHKVKLLDFGAARDYEGTEQKTMTVMLKPGYAPGEQYQSGKYQGPWTDVYAMCGVIYKCVTGKTPEDSLKRMFYDTMKTPSQMGAEISPEQEAVLLRGLELKYDKRIQSMQELKNSFLKMSNRPMNERAQMSNHPVNERAKMAQQVLNIENTGKIPAKKEKKRKQGMTKQKLAAMILGGIGVLTAMTVALILFFDNPYQYGDSHISIFEQKKITKGMIRRVNDPEITDLQFMECEISDEMLGRIAKLEYVTELEFTDCTGFTSLEPLTQMSNLQKICYDSDTINGEQIFPDGFEQLMHLTLVMDCLEGGTEFLNSFTGLQYLHFIGDPVGITDLNFLEYMPELTAFTLYGNENVDLSGTKTQPLGYCTKLEDLNLKYSKMDDVSFAENLTALGNLNAEGCNISDISALQGCTEMWSLNLDGNQVQDISALAGMEKLLYLYLNNNQVSDISSLAGKTELCTLQLANNQVSDISALEESAKLIDLNLANNQVTDLMPVCHAVGMLTFNISGNQITDLNACELMIDLTYLSVEDNQITDISKINSAKLKKADFSNNQISDLSVLENRCGELYLLNLNDNQVSDISVLTGAANLAVILADNNNLTNLSGLENKEKLYGVSAYNNQISDISDLSVSNIAYLDLGCNQVTDISLLANLQSSVVYLLLEKNQITDISCLPVTVKYSALALYGNPITDFSRVASFENINYLHDQLYFSHSDEVDYHYIGKSLYEREAYAVDVPLEQQSQIKAVMEGEKESNFDGVATFITSEEADEKLQAIRQARTDVLKTMNG